LNKDDIEEEIEIFEEQGLDREKQNKYNAKSKALYYKGKNIRNNKFKNHQLPKGKP
jgi:dTDP-4-amino-4,6-dideoxygalactose transaminase